jgi:hypothetical protein
VAEQIKSEVGSTPLVFENSYRYASMFAFYTGNRTFSLNNEHFRRNQYSIDDSESKVRHQKVLYISTYPRKVDTTFTKSNGGQFFGNYINDFESFRKLRTMVDGPISSNTDKELGLKVYNPYNQRIALKKLRFNIAYLTDFKKIKEAIPIRPKPLDTTITYLPANDTVNFKFNLPKPQMKDPGYFRVGISENGLPFGLNGENTELE